MSENVMSVEELEEYAKEKGLVVRYRRRPVPDLEPASALASKPESARNFFWRLIDAVNVDDLDASDRVIAERLISERDAAVREPLERQVQELTKRAESAEELFLAEQDRRGSLETDLAQIRDHLPTDWSNETELGGQAMLAVKAKWDECREQEERIASLEAQLANTHDVLVNLRGKRNELEAEALKAERAADARIAELEAQLASAPRWIPVEERLSFQGSPVLTLEAGGTMPMVCVYHDGTWYNIDNGSAYDVTHWMPIPPRPSAQREPHGR